MSHGCESNFVAVTLWGEPGKHRFVSVAQQWSFSEALHLLFVLAKVPTGLANVLAPNLTLCHQPALSASRGISKLHMAILRLSELGKNKGHCGLKKG